MLHPTIDDTNLRMPVGPFTPVAHVTPALRRACLDTLADAAEILRAALDGLDERGLDTPYRDGGWTPRQVVHHLADAHMNGFVRFKLALTEDAPEIKTYEEDLWGETFEARRGPVDVSIVLLEALHERWVMLLESLAEEQWARPFRHPQRGVMPLDKALQLYAWHVRHHAAHVALVRRQSSSTMVPTASPSASVAPA